MTPERDLRLLQRVHGQDTFPYYIVLFSDWLFSFLSFSFPDWFAFILLLTINHNLIGN